MVIFNLSFGVFYYTAIITNLALLKYLQLFMPFFVYLFPDKHLNYNLNVLMLRNFVCLASCEILDAQKRTLYIMSIQYILGELVK